MMRDDEVEFLGSLRCGYCWHLIALHFNDSEWGTECQLCECDGHGVRYGPPVPYELRRAKALPTTAIESAMRLYEDAIRHELSRPMLYDLMKKEQ